MAARSTPDVRSRTLHSIHELLDLFPLHAGRAQTPPDYLLNIEDEFTLDLTIFMKNRLRLDGSVNTLAEKVGIN